MLSAFPKHNIMVVLTIIKIASILFVVKIRGVVIRRSHIYHTVQYVHARAYCNSVKIFQCRLHTDSNFSSLNQEPVPELNMYAQQHEQPAS